MRARLVRGAARQGPVAEAAARALKALTREDFGTDRAQWTEWWNDKGKDDHGARGKRKSPDEAKEKEEADQKKGGTTFYGITTRSKRLLYVLDISGSMNEGEIQAKAGDGGGTSHTKIQVAKKELKTSDRPRCPRTRCSTSSSSPTASRSGSPSS